MLFRRFMLAFAMVVLALWGTAPALANGKDISFEADTVTAVSYTHLTLPTTLVV